MAQLTRPDGAQIEWRLHGDGGPLVVVSQMGMHPPGVLDRIVAELAPDHRVLTYDLRGTGASSEHGPYDLETDAADLAAVVEEAGGEALAIGLGDGARRAIQAAQRPKLVHTVVVSGEMPLGASGSVTATRGSLADSPAVLDALVQLLETDYRAGLRTLLESSEEDWSEGLTQERIDATAAHIPQEVGVTRLRSWIGDDSRERASRLGGRLWFLHYPSNAWFRGTLETLRKELPEAHFEPVPDGVISRPAENADVVRRILAAQRTAA